MTTAIQFRLPRITTRLSPTFGLPRGTFGRGIYTVKAIVLHSLRTSLESYDAQEFNLFIRDKAEPRHPSVHFALDYEGNCHQYVNVADIAWGSFDYNMGNFPAAWTPGDFVWFDTYAPPISPDRYCIHIAHMSGEDNDNNLALTPAAILNTARLIAYYCDFYEIECDEDNVVTHDKLDTQFAASCIAESSYPYAEILAKAQEIIENGGESDIIFEPAPIIAELYGPWTVGTSRVSSASYIIS